MINHIVLITFHEDLTIAQKQEAVKRFLSLGEKISEVISVEYGTNISHEGLDQGFTHCFLVTFGDAAARDRYPAHMEFVKYITPLCRNALVVDYKPAAHKGFA